MGAAQAPRSAPAQVRGNAAGQRAQARGNAAMAVLLALVAGAAGCGQVTYTHTTDASGPHATHPATASPGPSPEQASSRGQAAVSTRVVGISCVSAAACVIVGYRQRPADPALAFAERWGGSAWRQMPALPGPPESRGGAVDGISCLSIRDCWVVAQSGNPSADPSGIPYTIHWDGRDWSVSAVPLPTGTDPNLDGLSGQFSCLSATDCWAVGSATSTTQTPAVTAISEHWDGASWTLVPGPSTRRMLALTAVSCAAHDDCWAIGNWASSLRSQRGGTVTAHWNGAVWSVVPNPTDHAGTSGTMGSQPLEVAPHAATLTGIACARADSCVAVGARNGKPLAERWDGASWAVAPAPAPAHTTGSGLSAVACVGPSWCAAAGYDYLNGRRDRVLVEFWDGSAWRIQPTPALGALEDMGAIDCISTRACWSVGWAGELSLLARWDGISWSAHRLPTSPS